MFGFPLDNIFYRGLDTQWAQAVVVDSSDHNPMIVTFEVHPDLSQKKITAGTQRVTLLQ
jgi:hypothetical protein